MQRSTSGVITGWPLLILAPILVPLALAAGIWQRIFPESGRADRSPAEVMGFIQDFLDHTGGEWDWDEFEAIQIKDRILDAYRERAAAFGPPNANVEGLKQIIAEMRERYGDVR